MTQAQEMERLFNGKKYSELLQICKGRIDLFPEDVNALFYYASALHALGRYKESKNTFAKLFAITKDRLFLICESIPEFSGDGQEDAVSLLRKETEEDDKAENLLFVFRVAIKNGEFDVANNALRKAFNSDPKKTIDALQEIFEKTHAKSIEMRLLFATVIKMLRNLEASK